MVRFYIALIAFFSLIVWQPISAKAQPTLLAELFCNINCPNCPGPDSTYENYVSTHPGVVLINYHNSTTDINDPFYTHSKPASDDRDDFYGGPQNDPTAWIDGFAPASTGVWEDYTNQYLSHALPLITSSVEYGPSVSGGNIDTIKFSITGSSSTEVNYYVALKESQVFYVNTEDYGPTPGNLWNDVFRTMLPSATGSGPFTFSGTLDTFVVYDPSQYIYGWDEQNMTAVIFVQDANPSSGHNHQVEAIGEVSLAQPSAVIETASPSNRLIITSNPMTLGGHLGFELISAGDVRLTLCDMLGREVRTLVEGEMPAGQTSVEMNSVALPVGCYFARLTVNGIVADQAKFIVTP